MLLKPKSRRLGLALLAAGLPLMLAALAAQAAPAPATTVLYDGALGTLPTAQGFEFLSVGTVTQTWSGGATTLDSTLFTASYGGYGVAPTQAPTLNRLTGYTVLFAVQTLTETHAGSDRNADGVEDRAGFSVVVLSSDLQGIELGFWTDRLWAQEGGTGVNLFTQAEGITFATTSLITYTLSVSATTYALAANDQLILSGPLRDYTAFTGIYDPYETPNFIFLGDDSASAHGAARIAYVAVTPASTLTVPPKRAFLPLVAR